MVQPTKPPLSVRLGEARTARVDDYAKRRSLSRHGAIMELLDKALDRAERPAATVVKGVVKPAKTEPFKTRLKGEWKAP